MLDVKKIVTQKAHESCIKQLTSAHAPFELIQQFSYEFLEEIANTLSQVTRNIFLYTGNLTYKDKSIEAKFTTSDSKDVITLTVSYNYNTQEQEYKFDNLNQQLEKLVTGEEVPSKEPVQIPKEVEITIIKPENIIPNVNKILTNTLKKDKEEILNKKMDKLNTILDKKQKAQEVTKIIDKLMINDKKQVKDAPTVFDILLKK
jgi:cobalamin biosynthesis Mg chelatase CobN